MTNKDMQTIVLATRNKDKISELRASLRDFNITLKSSFDFPELEEVEEDRKTLEGNAIKKARYTFEITGLPCLADDTGLEVDALDGRPGVYSARYSGENATYEQNVEKLLAEMAGIKPKDRGAQFRTIAAFVRGDEPYTFEGVCRGTILTEGRGSGGFGYDPLFQPNGYDKTFAELEDPEKNKISHRGKAVQKFVEWLQSQQPT